MTRRAYTGQRAVASRAWVAGTWAALALGLTALATEPARAQAASAPPELEDLETLLNRPVYAASRFALEAAHAPAVVTVFSAGDIRAYGWRTLVEVLNGMRGLSTRDDRTYTTVGVRGFDPLGDVATRVLVTIDGMRVNENLFDEAVGGREFPLPVDLIERVEVITGPGSALYGPNAMFAVVNVITKSAAQLGGGSATMAFGSHRSRLMSVRKGLRLGDGSLVIAARAENRPGGDRCYAEYATEAPPDGCARGRDGETDRKLFARWSAGSLNVALIASDRTKFSPTGVYASDFGAAAPTTDRFTYGDLQWETEPAPGHKLYLRGSLARYGFGDRFSFGGESWRSQGRGRWHAGEARWLYEGIAGHRLIVGVEARHNTRQHLSNGYTDGTGFTAFDGRSARHALFANDDWVLSEQWRLSAGLRVDQLAEGGTRSTPRLGLVFTPRAGMHWKLLSGRAFREPSVYETRYEESGVVVGNPGLGIERLRTDELALDWRVQPNLRVAASGYRYQVDGVIGQGIDPVSGLQQWVNGGAARARGQELEIDYVPDSGWRMRASWSAQRTFDVNTGIGLPNSPRSLTKLHVTGPLPWAGWRLGIEGQRVGERSTRDGVSMPAYALANLTLQWTSPAAPWSLDFSLYNAFDRRHADPAGSEHRQTALERDRRNYAMTATLAF